MLARRPSRKAAWLAIVALAIACPGRSGASVANSDCLACHGDKSSIHVAQVTHYYEAVLATLAIAVWHLYWVVFDPPEYPAWLVGKKAPEASGAGEPPAFDAAGAAKERGGAPDPTT